MNIAIIGYGKMGREIERAANLNGINVASIIDPNEKGANRRIDEKSMRNVDVCIDFSTPDAVIGNIERAAGFRKNIVVGTTGWNDKIGRVRKIVNKNRTG